jgi:iron complex transport system substrate-binding protein
VPWREVLRRNGAQFGREQAAEQWIARFAERAAALRDRVAARYAGATWALAYAEPEQLYLYGPRAGHTAATLTDEVGLRLAPGVERLLAEAGPLTQGGGPVSFERLGELDADIVFVPVSAGPDGRPDRSGVDALIAQPLWASVPAVAAGRVHEFTGDIWYESGPMATAFLDVVERALLGP